MPSPFPCSPVVRECSWKKTQIEKKNDSQSIPVMALLSVVPRRETCFSPWAVIVMLSVTTNLYRVWSAFMISSSRMLYYSTSLVISKKNCDLTLTHKDLVMISRDADTARHETLIMWYNDPTQGQFTWKWIYLPNLSGLVWTRSFKNTPNDMSTYTSTSCLKGYDHRA